MAQLRGQYHFGETLKDLDLALSARSHFPAYTELKLWYHADAQARLRAKAGQMPRKQSLPDWPRVDDVVSAYWEDSSNLRRGFLPPDPDYTGGAHLTLEDGTESLLITPKPPTSKRPQALARAVSGVDEDNLGDGAGFNASRRDSQAPPPDHTPSFPTNGYWLPPISRPLTSVTQHARDESLRHNGVIPAEKHDRKDPHLPATWSLSPTPLSKTRKQRYTLYPQVDPDSAKSDAEEGRETAKKMSPFAAVKQDDIRWIKKAADLIRNKDFRTAFQELNDLIERYPDVARLYTMRAMCASKQGGHKVAIKDAKRALELDPTESKACYWAGVSASASGKPKVAATYLETALRMNPSSPRTAALFDKVCEQTLSARPYYQLQIAEPMKVPKARHGPKPPTPEPEPEPEKPPPQAAGMPANWEHIDLSDIVYEQTLLRDAILMALDEGITSKEVTVIVNMMKRAGHKKSTIAHVDEALGDGELDDEDLKLMQSLMPPEAHDDWMRILYTSEHVDGTEDQSLEGNYAYLRTLFRRYAVEGTVGMDDVEDMGIGQFKNFAKEIQIMNKTDLNAGAIDRMFIRANQDRSEGVDQFDRENMGQALKDKLGAQGSGPVDNQMALKEFIAGMIRMAHAKFKQIPSLADRWEAFMSQHVKKYADIGNLEDETSMMLNWSEVKHVLDTHAGVLKQTFLNYCVSEGELGVGMESQAQMMNMSEFMRFLAEAKLLDKQLTVREARGIFVQVNLDDDLFVQEDANNTSSELVLDEFIECLVRVAWEKEPLQSMAGGDAEDSDYREEVAECLSEWLALAIAPFGEEPKKKKKSPK